MRFLLRPLAPPVTSVGTVLRHCDAGKRPAPYPPFRAPQSMYDDCRKSGTCINYQLGLCQSAECKFAHNTLHTHASEIAKNDPLWEGAAVASAPLTRAACTRAARCGVGRREHLASRPSSTRWTSTPSPTFACARVDCADDKRGELLQRGARDEN